MHMNKVSSFEIKEALSKKHRAEFFVTECKNGPTFVPKGALLQFDAVAIYKSWSRPQIRGYEIKVSRSDFLADAKYHLYRPYFHEFYFAVPAGLIKREEIEEGIGLIYYNPETGSLTTKRRAEWKNIEIDPHFLLYIIMNRLDSDRAPFMLHKDEVFRAWLKEKESTLSLSRNVKGKLIKENAELQMEIVKIKHYETEVEKRNEILDVLRRHGINTGWGAACELEKALAEKYPKSIGDIERAANTILDEVRKIKNVSGEEGDAKEL